MGLRKAQTAAGTSTVRATKPHAKPKPLKAKTKVGKTHGLHKRRGVAQPADEGGVLEVEATGLDVEGVEGLDSLHHGREAEAHSHRVDDDEGEEPVKADSGATTSDAVTRADSDSDGYSDGEDPREIYARALRGAVQADADRIAHLKAGGTVDTFDPGETPAAVEARGVFAAAAHVVRLHEAWTLEGVPRDRAIERVAAFLAAFANTGTVRKVLALLEERPIRDVYPLEVLAHLLHTHPQLLPGVRAGSVLCADIENAERLGPGGDVRAGHPALLTVPAHVRLKAFALLGGGRPGYAFHPHHAADRYALTVDTPGTYRCALLAAPTTALGRIQRESGEAILEVFTVHVQPVEGDAARDDTDGTPHGRPPDDD